MPSAAAIAERAEPNGIIHGGLSMRLTSRRPLCFRPTTGVGFVNYASLTTPSLRTRSFRAFRLSRIAAIALASSLVGRDNERSA